VTVGGTLELEDNGRSRRVPVADTVYLARANRSRDDRFELDVKLTWSTADGDHGHPANP
jgi:hypothetical protein